MRHGFIIRHTDYAMLARKMTLLHRLPLQAQFAIPTGLPRQIPHADIRSRFRQDSEDLIAVDPPRAVAVEMEHWVQQGCRTVEIDEADAHVMHGGIEAQRAHSLDDEDLECLDEGPVMDARAVIVGIRVAADVVDDDVDGFETRTAVLVRCDDSGGEEGAADAAGVGEGFEAGGCGA